MTRVFIDPHMFSQDWFPPVLTELLNSQGVVFVYAMCAQGRAELSQVRQALAFQKLVLNKKDRRGRARGVLIDESRLRPHLDYLAAHHIFDGCGECDDPHIFALVRVIPTPYIFSHDRRMAGCRDQINRHVDRRYCGFVVISREQVYEHHRHAILSP